MAFSGEFRVVIGDIGMNDLITNGDADHETDDGADQKM
jgi:hypothetical protein